MYLSVWLYLSGRTRLQIQLVLILVVPISALNQVHLSADEAQAIPPSLVRLFMGFYGIL